MVNIEKIEKERTRLGLNRSEFAIKIGITKQAYYDLLKNKSTKLTTLDRIAKVLDFDARDLLI